MVGVVAPRDSQCPLLFEKQILRGNPATLAIRSPSRIDRPDYNSTTYLDAAKIKFCSIFMYQSKIVANMNDFIKYRKTLTERTILEKERHHAQP